MLKLKKNNKFKNLKIMISCFLCKIHFSYHNNTIYKLQTQQCVPNQNQTLKLTNNNNTDNDSIPQVSPKPTITQQSTIKSDKK